MRVVVALGGNALLQRGEAPDAEIQEHHVRRAVAAIAPLARQHDLVITHGNGPQVGVLATESASDPSLSHPYPFDALVAQTQGLIGYWLVQALDAAIPGRKAVCLLSRTVVDESDPGFADPAKFVGPVYDKEQAALLATTHGWEVRPDGAYWRRVVPSPRPLDIVELELIRLLVTSGAMVVCQGGGGIPVLRGETGELRGVEAVIDKDLAAALLAEKLGADALLLLTDVPAVQLDYGTPEARPIRRTTAAELRRAEFPAGSMGPKVDAACRFAERTGGVAAIGRLDDAGRLLNGDCGTLITGAVEKGTSAPVEETRSRP